MRGSRNVDGAEARRGAKIKSVQTFSLAATHHAVLSLVNIGASTMEPIIAISFGTKGSRMSSGHLKVAGQLKLLGGENHKTIYIFSFMVDG